MPGAQMFPKGTPQGGTDYGFVKVLPLTIAEWRLRIQKHLEMMDKIHKEQGLPSVILLAAPKGPTDPTASPESFKEMMDVITRPIDLKEPADNQLDPDYDERAVYLVSGRVDIAGEVFESGQLLVFKPGDRISILAETNARLMLLGGEPMDGPRHIWWNFVSSSKERIDEAKNDWRQGRFAIVPGDEQEFIPLPEDRSPPK